MVAQYSTLYDRCVLIVYIPDKNAITQRPKTELLVCHTCMITTKIPTKAYILQRVCAAFFP